ncbi:hypothetical protein RAJCM14343_5316 [Rhodococcus aetherivorans]|uniref:Mobile element protein n=1 Tax=Rhodococcus aetherivorans TaxID=191292 RepID=A0ABQ0YTR0_9NOCA|nr:hypothetical protein RAJCM14343_5316 [Rhodococcus aetherivorans]
MSVFVPDVRTLKQGHHQAHIAAKHRLQSARMRFHGSPPASSPHLPTS